MARSLPRSTPGDQQVDPAAILRFLDAVEDHPGVEMHSLMVVRHGHVVAEGWWAPYSALPGLGTTAPDDGSAHRQLTTRLGRLALPACQAGPAPADWTPWTGPAFRVAAGAGDGQVHPPLSSVAVAPGPDGWQIRLSEAANSLTFPVGTFPVGTLPVGTLPVGTLPVGTGDWAVSAPADDHGDTIPVAASGGWLDDHTLRAEIIFLETPHRMDVTCSLAGRRATASWRHPPLNAGKLQDLHCPG